MSKPKQSVIDFSKFYELCTEQEKKDSIAWKIARGFLCALISAALGYAYLTYYAFISKLWGYVALAGLTLIVIIGVTVSKRIRCSLLLCLPELTTKSVRQALIAIMTWGIIYAMVQSISHNLLEGNRSFQCMSQVSSKGVNKVRDAVLDTLQDISGQLNNSFQQTNKLLIELEDIFNPFINYIEAGNQELKEFKINLEKLKVDCKEGYITELRVCVEASNAAKEKCKEFILDDPILNWFPYLFKVCEITELGSGACKILKSIDVCEALDVGILSLLDFDAVERKVQHVREYFRLQFYKGSGVEIKTNINQIKEEQTKQFEVGLAEIISYFKWTMKILNVVFALVPLFIPIQSYFYLKDLLAEAEYYRKFINAEALPGKIRSNKFLCFNLKRKYQKKYLAFSDLKLKTLIKSVVIFLVVLSITCVIFGFDYAVYHMFSPSKTYDPAAFEIRTSLNFHAGVHGDGPIAELMKSIFVGIKLQNDRIFKIHTDQCKPNLVAPNTVNQILFLIFVFIFSTISWLFEFLVLKVRRPIAALFYSQELAGFVTNRKLYLFSIRNKKFLNKNKPFLKFGKALLDFQAERLKDKNKKPEELLVKSHSMSDLQGNDDIVWKTGKPRSRSNSVSEDWG